MKTKGFFKRLTSVILVLSMMLAITPAIFANTASALTNPYKIESDAATLDTWKSFFGPDFFDTVNAGGVWTDKSVFTDPALLGSLVNTDGSPLSISRGDNNFLVALSAIAANKSIVGYSHIPTDTILVLDISGSMGPGWGNNDAVEDMVTAANAAITNLQNLNKHNRVGVVLYSSNSNDDSPAVLLPLGKYETDTKETYNNGTPGDTSDDKVISVYLETNNYGNTVSIASDVYYHGTTTEVSVKTVEVTGGTYTQSGIDTAMDMFLAVDKNDTVIGGNDFQSGTERRPVIVLMSDGDATYANTNYADVPSGSNVGNGRDSSNNNRFLTQLTAAQAKARISEHYNDAEMLFYTLGLGGGMSSILDPNLASAGELNLWNSFVNLDNDEYLNIANRAVRPSQHINSVDDMYYVTDAFEAKSKADLYNTFEKIVNQIIIQSLYSPTNVSTTTDFDGFITFTDKLGSYMEVKDVKGILLGNTLFSGSHFAEIAMNGTGSLGTPDNATDLGNDFVWAVIQRMGLSAHPNYPTYAEQLAEARSLINLAYTHGQISYNSATGEFNNFIGWYADKDGRYIGFWDPEHTDDMVPEGAVYTNKCYGMLGYVKDGYRESDMLYITIQIHTEIDTMDQTVVFSIPSSLIPVVSYNVTLEGESLEDATNINVDIDSAEPIRLLYEVGLRSGINSITIGDKVGTNNKNADDTYTFYTNAYDAQIIKDSEDAEARGDESHIGEPGDNTFANFRPSLENERYYYNVNTAIYTLSGTSYIPYGADTAPKDFSGDLYRAYTHFKKNASDKWELYTDYAKINHDTLVYAERYTSGDNANDWYIPAGTIHHNLNSTEIKKANGESVNDVEYYYYQFIHENASHDSTYHIDTILGNNGKLTVTPSTALAVSKKIDDTITDLNATYSFTVSGGDANTQFTLVTEDSAGNMVYSSAAFDANGKYAFNIKAGMTVYLAGVDAGSYAVSEIVDSGANYHVSSISVNGVQKSGDNVSSVSDVSVVDRSVTAVEFTNTLGTGTPLESYLIITKTVTHDFGENYVIDTSKTFPIKIDLGSAYANDSVEIHSTLNDTVDKTADANGVVSYDIAHAEHIALSIRVGTTVNVTEELGNSYPGFNTPVISYTNGNLTGDAAKTVVADSNLTVGIVNDYDATAVNPVNVTLNVSKVLEGRDWLDTDAFTFQLQRYNPHDASYEVVGALEAKKGDTELDFTSIIKSYDFDRIGEYHFRVIEIAGAAPIGGMTYDLVGRYFNVVVTDNLSGELVISDVQATSLTSVTLDNGVYNIKANDVVNVYAPAGNDEVFVNVNKTVSIKDAPAGVTGNFTLSGFEFGLYDENGELAADPFVTDASGNVQIKLMFSASSLDGNKKASFYYTVKEIAPANDTTYNYDTTEYKIRIDIVDNLDGTVGAVLNIYDESADDYVAASTGNTASISFVNEYVISGTVSKTLNIQKIMQNLGTKEHGLADFIFELRDENNSLVDSFTSDAAGKTSLKFEYDVTDIGKTYVYTLREKDTGIANMDYSDEVYTITANVTLTAGNELALEVTVKNSAATTVIGDLEFTNVYDEDIPPAGSDSVTITIDKSVSIKDAPAGVTGNLSPAGFEFILTDATGAEVGKYTVDASGKATITLIYTADEHVGNTYYYILKEIIPNDNLYEYDTTEYKFKVRVINNRDGTISAKLSVYDLSAQDYVSAANDSYTAEFENKFIISGDATLDFTIVKKIDSIYGFTLSPEGFVFIMREASTGTEIGRLTTDSSGRATFSSNADISLIGATATITVEELNDSRENVVYSTEKYTITVTVELNVNNEVVIVPTITDINGQPVSGTTLEFTNVYNYNEAPPTGDNTFLIGAAVALVSLIGSAIVFTKKRRQAE